MKRKKLLFLGIDNTVSDAIEYAKSKNVYTIVTDFYSPEIKKEKKMADEYWMIDVADFEALKKKCMEEGVTNIYTGTNEFCLDQCKRLCKELRYPFYASDEGWIVSRDKEIYKEKCRSVGLLTPKQYYLDKNFSGKDLEKIQYPVVVKPSDSNARKGLSIVSNQEELLKAYEKALEYSENKRIIVEEYIDGNEVFIGCYVHNKKLRLLYATANQFIMIDGQKRFGFNSNFSRFTKLVDEQLLSKYQKLVSDLKCENGVCMFQCISRNNLMYNVEFGYRLDGLRIWARVARTQGINQLKMMVDLALGESVSEDAFIAGGTREKHVCYLMWTLPGKIAKIVGRDELYSRDDISILIDHFNEGDTVLNVSDLRSVGIIVGVFGKSYKEITEKIIDINKNVHFYDENMNDMLIHRAPDIEDW